MNTNTKGFVKLNDEELSSIDGGYTITWLTICAGAGAVVVGYKAGKWVKNKLGW